MPRGRADKRYTAGPMMSHSHTTQTLFFTYRVHNFGSIRVDDFCTFNAATITINITAMAETYEEERSETGQRGGDPQVRGMTHKSERGDPQVRGVIHRSTSETGHRGVIHRSESRTG